MPCTRLLLRGAKMYVTHSQIQELLFQSLMEMELIHRQEELEHADLERALQMSLMVEEERLHDLMSSGPDDDAHGAGAGAKIQQDNKVCIHTVYSTVYGGGEVAVCGPGIRSDALHLFAILFSSAQSLVQLSN
jgi:hypothetical protein